MDPFVSVIIPNYNHARYLDQRIQSVLNQTYQNFEVIILDDKSTDNSIDVIEKYRGHKNVAHIVINEENSGSTFMQWDKGISLAKGDLIWIAESDDYCEYNLMEELISAYKKCPGCVLAYTTSIVVNQKGEEREERHQERDFYIPGDRFIKNSFIIGNVIRNASSAIFSKKACLEAASDYKTFKGAGDLFLWFEIAKRGCVAVVNKQLNYFRRHEGVVTEKRYNDGTNYREEYAIYCHIKKKQKFGKSYESYLFTSRWYQILNREFESTSIKKELLQLWQCPYCKEFENYSSSQLFWISRRLLSFFKFMQSSPFIDLYLYPTKTILKLATEQSFFYTAFIIYSNFLVGYTKTKEIHNEVMSMMGCSHSFFSFFISTLKVKSGSINRTVARFFRNIC